MHIFLFPVQVIITRNIPGMQLGLISKQTETNLNQQTLSHKPGS